MRWCAKSLCVCLAVVAALFATSALVQAEDILKLDIGATGQSLASGWEEFSFDDASELIASDSYSTIAGNLTVSVSTAGSENLQFKNRDAVSYLDPPGEVLSDCTISSDSDMTLQISGLAAGSYYLTTYLHDSRWGGDGRISEWVSLDDANGSSIVGTDVYYTRGTGPDFYYKLVPGGSDYFQNYPSMLAMTVTSNGNDPISVVYMGGMYQGKSTSAALSGFVLSEVPEPSSVVLLACGLIGLLAFTWRGRK